MSKAPYGTCSNCRFYMDTSMQCRRHAPQGHIAPDRTECSSYSSNWPLSDKNDWCGEWMKLTDIQLSSLYGDGVVSDPDITVIVIDPYTRVLAGSSAKFGGGNGGSSGGGAGGGGNGGSSGGGAGGGAGHRRFENVGVTTYPTTEAGSGGSGGSEFADAKS